ncbi:MAG: butyrate kinase [Myxococcota bacterium]|jgi:butyrate kinase|nr:butyrate kinase [Myxococcota bacterium]
MYPLEVSIDHQLREQRGPQPTLIFPEADDPRVITATSALVQYAKIVLVRSRADVCRDLDNKEIPLKVSRKRYLASVRCIEPGSEPELLEEFAAQMSSRSTGKTWAVTKEQALELCKKPVYFAIMAVRQGYADAVLGGVAHASRDFFHPALRLLDRSGTVYEMGLFALPDSHDAGLFRENLLMIADVALNPEPSAERLADIAVGACMTMRQIIPVEVMPQINGALLSYSTRGSGAGPSVERVRQAEPLINEMLRKLAEENPLASTVNIVTELQISCAISKKAAMDKLGPDLERFPAAGNANVLIVPSLDVGNLLYHIYRTRYQDGQNVLIIGGMMNQALDFSRSSTPEDVAMGAKALILRMYKSGRFQHTPKDRFFPRFRLLTISPQNEYTEAAVWEGRDLLYRERLPHRLEDLDDDVLNQVPVRVEAIEGFLSRKGVDKASIVAFIGRGGLILPVESGTYRVDDKMLDDLDKEVAGRHVVNLGAVLAHKVAPQENQNVFIVDPAVVDELDDLARITGLRGTDQEAVWHALAHKAIAKQHALLHGKEYEDLNLIVAFVGAGTSVGAHRHGRCVKVRNALFDGPMSMDRAGSLPGRDLIDLCYSGMSKDEVVHALTCNGGIKSYLGTDKFLEVEKLINAGDEEARQVSLAMIEQIAAEIAMLVPKFEGEVIDKILLTGALTRSQWFIGHLRRVLSQLPIEMAVYPGNLEIEALRDGALRVLSGIEPLREYRPLRAVF